MHTLRNILKLLAAVALLTTLGACTIVPPRFAYTGPRITLLPPRAFVAPPQHFSPYYYPRSYPPAGYAP